MPPTTKITYARTIRLIGLNKKSNKITLVPRTICFRKGMRLDVAKRATRGFKEKIGLMSSPNTLYATGGRLCKFWCHCLKNPEEYLKRPGMLLSESDFVDPSFVSVFPRQENFKWDFYYFTAGGQHGRKHKGAQLFARSLSILCGKYGMRGLIIKYVKSNRPFIKSDNRIIKKYRSNLHIISKVTPDKVASIMAKSRFGFFPNNADCSPLLLAESLIRDCPVLVNEDIWGGWKYVNEQTGALFNLSNLEEKVQYILDGDFDPRPNFTDIYGYKNTAERFATEAAPYVKNIRAFSMVGFDGTSEKMRSVI